MKQNLVLLFLFPALSYGGVSPSVVRGIFQKHCVTCHGTKGAGEGGFDSILDLPSLVRGRDPKVTPRNIDASPLFQRIRDKEMPPPEIGDVVSAAELEQIKLWIQEGGQSEESPLASQFSETDILKAVQSDFLLLSPEKQQNVRYLTFNVWQYSEFANLLSKVSGAANKALNSLSWEPGPIQLRAINPVVYALDLAQIGWTGAQWEQAVDEYPYLQSFGNYAGPELQGLRSTTGTKIPLVRGDWLIREITRPLKYYFLLQLPENERSLEAALVLRGARLNLLNDVQSQELSRSGFNSSGVALKKNRMLQRHEFEYRLKNKVKRPGYFWRSYDTKLTTGRGNYFNFPLTVQENPDYAFSFDGGEFIFSLPNGFQAYYLSNAKGNRANDGPIDLVSGTKSRPLISNGISCMECHSRGLIIKQDEIREHVLSSAFPKNVQEIVAATYPPSNEMKALFAKDMNLHANALHAIGVSEQNPDPINVVVNAYEDDLNPAQAAVEMGVSLEEFLHFLSTHSGLDAKLRAIRSGRNISRTEWEEQYAGARALMNIDRSRQ